jgi:hypothetical protein
MIPPIGPGRGSRQRNELRLEDLCPRDRYKPLALSLDRLTRSLGELTPDSSMVVVTRSIGVDVLTRQRLNTNLIKNFRIVLDVMALHGWLIAIPLASRRPHST